MTNPNNSVGTNGAFGGRTSVNAFNDVMGAFTRGILSGWECVPNSGLTVSLGGNGTTRDSAIAVDNAGNKTSINNISNSPINVTIGAAPGTNSRIDAIVAYVDNPPSGTATSTDNPDSCGLIVVQGTTASTPSVPTEVQIRSGITADGASGTTAYYVVLAYITMASGTTDITSGEISNGDKAKLGASTMLDVFYPVGSYYETSDTSFDPNISWGGTWAEDSWGRVTVAYQSDQPAFDTVGEIGGSMELQKHSHTYDIKTDSGSGDVGSYLLVANQTGTVYSGATGAIQEAGTGEAGNLQPYIVVKRWHRTA